MSDLLKKTVVEWINEVNYNIDEAYIPSTFALEFVVFIKQVNGDIGEENLTPVVHFKMLDNIAGKKQDTLNLCHRGIAKTTLLGEYLFLYLGVYGSIPGFGSIPLAIYVSDSIENGVKNMRKNLEYRWENSDFLRHYIPKTRFTDVRWEFNNRDGGVFIVKGYGAKTGVRGAKELGQRPTLAVLDDLISDEDARSATVISSVEDTVYKAVDYALHPTKKKIIWSGTPFNARDPLYKAVESGAWYVNVYPVCEKFPVPKEEFRGSWPDRFTFEYVEAQYNKALMSGKIDTFNQEMMLRIMSDEDRLILDGDMRWYDRETLMNNISAYNVYITTDFATSEKESADYSYVSVWAYNSNGDFFWLDGVCKRQDMGKNVDDLFRLVGQYKPYSVGVEVTGQQGGFIPFIQREMLSRNNFFNLASDNNGNAPGLRPSTNKMQRFNTVVPWFKMGKMYFPKQMKKEPALVELVEELSLAAPNGFRSKHDDAIDTVSMLSSMPLFKPSAELPMSKSYTEEGVNIWEADEEPDTTSGLDSYIV